MEPRHPPRHIIIVGAGIAGIACALALSRELTPFVPDLKITIYERHNILSTSGGAINLTPVAQRHLAQLGVLDDLDRMGSEGGAEVDAIQLFSMRSGRSIGSVDFVDHHGNGFGGYKGRRVMRIVLSVALMTAVERTRNIEIVFGRKVVGGEEINDKAVVHFHDGTEAIGDLVVGCDGVHSTVRSRWVDPGSRSQYTGMSFVQATIPTDSISSPIHFRSSALNISRHGSMLTSYCDRDREQISAAATVQFSEEDLRHFRLEPGQDWATQHRIQSALRSDIRSRFAKAAMPCIREIVNSRADWMLYPVYQVRPGGRWCMNRIILLGDAAHAVGFDPSIYASSLTDGPFASDATARRVGRICSGRRYTFRSHLGSAPLRATFGSLRDVRASSSRYNQLRIQGVPPDVGPESRNGHMGEQTEGVHDAIPPSQPSR